MASRLVERLVQRLRAEYAACREVELGLELSDGSVLHASTTLYEPADQAGALLRAIDRLMERMVAPTQNGDGARSQCSYSRQRDWDEGTAVSGIRITLAGLGGHHAEQEGLFRNRTDDLKKARRTVRQLEDQMGEGVIRSLSGVPEARIAGHSLRVVADEMGRPRALLLEGRWERVREISNRWRVVEGWWRREVAREYYRVITNRGRLCLIFSDLTLLPPSLIGKGELIEYRLNSGTPQTPTEGAASPLALPRP